MKRSAVIISFIVTVICIVPVSSRSAEVTTVADISLLGGQYFLDDSPSSFGGNVTIYAAPVVSFADGGTLLPVFSAVYRGTRDVRELVGGDTLVRQTADLGLNIKYSRTFGETTAAARLSLGKALVNETVDENWGTGLFDYARYLVGAEVSRETGPGKVTLSADYYATGFNNYASLVSELDEDDFGSAIDPETYTEISENAGTNVLDFRGAALSAQLDRHFASAGYRIDMRAYPDQSLVLSDGSFSSDKRKDMVNTLTGSLMYPTQRVEIGISGEASLHSSNQNSFDAGSAKFIKNFYSYTNFRLSPSVSLLLGSSEKPSRLSLRWHLGWRLYRDRPARNAAGEYLTDSVTQAETGMNVSFAYPLTETLSASISGGMLTASSNSEYEGNYRYNYTVTNYFAGINWKY